MTADLLLAEVTRGGFVESRHEGAFAIVGPGGAMVRAGGDIDRPIYPRSAIKAMQCLAVIESGAAERFGFDDAEIALACASHGGEPAHVESDASADAQDERSVGDAAAEEIGRQHLEGGQVFVAFALIENDRRGGRGDGKKLKNTFEIEPLNGAIENNENSIGRELFYFVGQKFDRVFTPVDRGIGEGWQLIDFHVKQRLPVVRTVSP